MNPMVQAFVLAGVRWGLTLFGAHVAHTSISEGDVREVSGWVISGLGLAWSLEEKYHFRQLLMQTLSRAMISEKTAKAMVKDPDVVTPSVTTPAHEIPTV